MIKNLHIQNFKCFRDIAFTFGKLTILAGRNSVGKSSIIQSFLLSKQAAESGIAQLNGPFALELGTVNDILARGSTIDRIAFEFSTSEGREFNYRFFSNVSAQEERCLVLQGYPFFMAGIDPFGGIGPLAFTYLCADRLGPKDVLTTGSLPRERLRIGPHGEFVAQVLSAMERDKVGLRRLHPIEREFERPNSLARHQIERWLEDIFGQQISLDAKPILGTNAYFIRIHTGDIKAAEPERPTNVGFGISYALPIIVAGVLVPQNGLLLIENPEAHLDPSAQSKMAQFLCCMADDGIQVILETHSDHILNGVRLGISRGQIQSGDVEICYLRKAEPGSESAVEVLTPKIQPDGRIENWPQGFFDQLTIDLEKLLNS